MGRSMLGGRVIYELKTTPVALTGERESSPVTVEASYTSSKSSIWEDGGCCLAVYVYGIVHCEVITHKWLVLWSYRMLYLTNCYIVLLRSWRVFLMAGLYAGDISG